MSVMTTMEKTKVAGFVDRGYNATTRQKRMEAEEAEIKRLEAEARGEKVEDTQGAGEEEKGEEEVQTTPKERVQEGSEADVSGDDDKGLTAEEKSFKKRYGDLRRYMQEKEKEWNDKFESLEKRSAKEGILPPKSDEDLDAWAKKYPDVASIVQTIARKQAAEMFEKADSRLKELDKITQETNIAKAESVIRSAHPDFDKLRDSDAFHEWVESQPKVVQDALYENSDDPKSVIRVIDLYKVDNGLTPSAKKEKTKSAATEVPAKGRVSIDEDGAGEMVRESQVARMSDKEFEENYERIMKAQRSGKFIYDISGKAR